MPNISFYGGFMLFTEYVISCLEHGEFDILDRDLAFDDNTYIASKGSFGPIQGLYKSQFQPRPTCPQNPRFILTAYKTGWPWDRHKRAMLRREDFLLVDLQQVEHDMLYDAYHNALDHFNIVMKPEYYKKKKEEEKKYYYYP